MSSEYMPEQKTASVTFGQYVIPNTVQEYAPLPPADPVPFVQAPAPQPKALQTPFGKAHVRFDPDLISMGLLLVVVFFVAALAGYFFSSGGSADVAGLLRDTPHATPLFQTQIGPRLTSIA